MEKIQNYIGKSDEKHCVFHILATDQIYERTSILKRLPVTEFIPMILMTVMFGAPQQISTALRTNNFCDFSSGATTRLTTSANLRQG